MNSEVLDRLEQQMQDLLLPVAKPLPSLQAYKEGDPNELLENRFLCRGGAATLVGPTGIGKSTLALQMAIHWAIARPAFDIKPTGKLRILHVQAENDEADFAEMRDGITGHLGIAEEEVGRLLENYLTVMEDCASGLDFCQNLLRPLARKHRPDLIIIDPALSYLGGEVNNQQQVGEFLRMGLSPILHEFSCGMLMVHHTNKPPSGNQKPDWSAGDYAYLGSGSAEWANWPRAVIALRSIGSDHVFELRLAKRGKRVGWTDEAGNTTMKRYISHSNVPGQMFWEAASAEEMEIIQALEAQSKRKGPPVTSEAVLEHVPKTGTVSKIELEQRLRMANLPINPSKDMITLLIERRILEEVRTRRPGVRPAIHVQRKIQAGLVTNAE